jgi:hypothetical protein
LMESLEEWKPALAVTARPGVGGGGTVREPLG